MNDSCWPQLTMSIITRLQKLPPSTPASSTFIAVKVMWQPVPSLHPIPALLTHPLPLKTYSLHPPKSTIAHSRAHSRPPRRQSPKVARATRGGRGVVGQGDAEDMGVMGTLGWTAPMFDWREQPRGRYERWRVRGDGCVRGCQDILPSPVERRRRRRRRCNCMKSSKGNVQTLCQRCLGSRRSIPATAPAAPLPGSNLAPQCRPQTTSWPEVQGKREEWPGAGSGGIDRCASDENRPDPASLPPTSSPTTSCSLVPENELANSFLFRRTASGPRNRLVG